MCGMLTVTGDFSSYKVPRNCYAWYFNATFGMMCEVKNNLAISKVVTVVLIKIQVLLDMTPCWLGDSHRHYGEDFVAKKSVLLVHNVCFNHLSVGRNTFPLVKYLISYRTQVFKRFTIYICSLLPNSFAPSTVEYCSVHDLYKLYTLKKR